METLTAAGPSSVVKKRGPGGSEPAGEARGLGDVPESLVDAAATVWAGLELLAEFADSLGPEGRARVLATLAEASGMILRTLAAQEAARTPGARTALA